MSPALFSLLNSPSQISSVFHYHHWNPIWILNWLLICNLMIKSVATNWTLCNVYTITQTWLMSWNLNTFKFCKESVRMIIYHTISPIDDLHREKDPPQIDSKHLEISLGLDGDPFLPFLPLAEMPTPDFSSQCL